MERLFLNWWLVSPAKSTNSFSPAACGIKLPPASSPTSKLAYTTSKAQIEETTSDYDSDKLRERLAELADGGAVIRVGGATKVEIEERRTAWRKGGCIFTVYF